MSSIGDKICWICHDGSTELEPLEQPCPCPRYVHRGCLGRWQLQCAGRSEECTCRFCGNALPGLGETLTPAHLRQTEAAAFMAVTYNGESHKVPVRPGIEGVAEFRARVKCLFGMPYDADFNVSFFCMAPTTGEVMTFRGMQCFNAAATCAGISAARRAVGETEITASPQQALPAGGGVQEGGRTGNLLQRLRRIIRMRRRQEP
ncbi:hypothetical protein PLESTM_000865700 [Pleodorina starrii]|nr:hypothetical protein PLESTM_000865700 [Pleodorina starrii]